MFNLEKEGYFALMRIKNNDKFPYETGNLKFNATSGLLIKPNTYRIKFDGIIAPYVEYLQEGTRPHDIPRAFGYPLPFGIGGRFNGKFHPGSTKHKGFIDNLTLDIVQHIARKYNGRYEKI